MNSIINKKTLSKIGMIGGAVVIILGILVLVGAMGGDAIHPSEAPYPYDSGYATFGADFYNYVCNNTQETASAARAAAANLWEISQLLKIALGVFLMAFGLFMSCTFGIKLAEERPAAAAALPEEPAPADEPAREEQSSPAPDNKEDGAAQNDLGDE